MTTALLEIENLHASAQGVKILHGIDLAIQDGELHALMGPNGSGKSTLASVLMGHPGYHVTEGHIRYRGTDITSLTPDERARMGIFLSFQYPQEIHGVKILNLMQVAMSRRRGADLSLFEVRLALMERMAALDIDESFMDRYLNQDFSGGEKKRNEILQLALLEPDLAILDETDSGLDIDALRVVTKDIKDIRQQRPKMAGLLITHYRRILDYLMPDVVHVLIDGRIYESGGPEIAAQLDAEGFDAFKRTDIREAS